MIAEHYRWNGKKASHLKGFGNFLFSKFLGNSIDEIVACRGSNRIWTSVFPYSSGFSVAAPFFRGLRRLDFRKIGEKSFTKLWALDCWFSRTKSSAFFALKKGCYRLEVRNERRKRTAERKISARGRTEAPAQGAGCKATGGRSDPRQMEWTAALLGWQRRYQSRKNLLQ